MSEDFMETFDDAIDEICGEPIEIIKESKYDHYEEKLRNTNPSDPTDRFWQEFEEWRKESHEMRRIYDGCVVHKYECECGEVYKIYHKPNRIRSSTSRGLDGGRNYAFPDEPLSVRSEMVFCMLCRKPWRAYGEIKLIENVGSDRRVRFRR
jgi:hypothetical protein